MPLVLPNFDRVPLEKPPLQLVLAQVQFQPILGLAEPKVLAPFQEAVRADFPSLSRVASLEVAVGPDGIETKPSLDNGWALEDDRGRRILVDPNSLTLETRRYETFEDFRDTFIAVLRSFVTTVKPSRRTRLGLRYINHIVFDEGGSLSGLRPLVRPELMGLVADASLTDDAFVMHSLGETRLAYDESQILARYGFLPKGAGFDSSRKNQPFFLLDVDHFDVRPVADVVPDSIEAELTQFHIDSYRLFRWSLTSEGEEHLGIGGPS
jgi:uncharacterized protein (TIGR04255 family)